MSVEPRVLGAPPPGYTPLPSQSQEPGPSQEITSLNSDIPYERTPLISSSARRVRRKNRTNTSSEDLEAGPTTRRPLRLKVSFIMACILFYFNILALILCVLGINSPLVLHNALPAHFGSMFIPIWLSVISLTANSLTLIAFVKPLESPHLAWITSLLAALFVFTMSIIMVAVNQLRHQENLLTFLLAGVALLSLAHSAASAVLVERYAPLLDSTLLERPPDPGFFSSVARAFKAFVSFIGVSLPIIIGHLAIVLVSLLLIIGIIVRAFDASMERPGQLWRIDPWRKRQVGAISEVNGRPFNLHLHCRGVDLEPYSNHTLVSTVPGTPAPRVRRTIVVETEQGISGEPGARWVTRMLEDGKLTDVDTEIRVCYYDRPGYGFSDNSPTSSIAHVATALREALRLSGEIARLTPTRGSSVLDFSDHELNSDNHNITAPSPLARSGFILVGSGYGALLSTMFGAYNPHLIHSALYLSPIPPQLHYGPGHGGIVSSFNFLFSKALGSLASDLGVLRLWSVLKGRSRARRVYSTETEYDNGGIQRAFLQEAAEKHRPGGTSAEAWERVKSRYPSRPGIVVSPVVIGTGKYGYNLGDWLSGQERFVREIIGEGLLEWNQDTWGGKCEGEDLSLCENALLKLTRGD